MEQKKERVKTANEKIIETVLKRLILEKYTPKNEDLKRIIEGKSRDFKVKTRDLLTEEQILTTVYTRIFESDLITQEQREGNLKRLIDIFEKEKLDSNQKIELALKRESKKSKNYVNSLIWLGLISSVIGVFLSNFNTIVNFDTEYPKLDSIIGITLLGSISGIIITYIFIRFKDSTESSEEVNTNRNFKNQTEFEEAVLKVFKKNNIGILMSGDMDSGIDFTANIKGKKNAIIIKYWTQRPPIAFVNKILHTFSENLKKHNIEEGIIIAPKAYNLSNRIANQDNIRLMEISELKRIV